MLHAFLVPTWLALNGLNSKLRESERRQRGWRGGGVEGGEVEGWRGGGVEGWRGGGVEVDQTQPLPGHEDEASQHKT